MASEFPPLSPSGSATPSRAASPFGNETSRKQGKGIRQKVLELDAQVKDHQRFVDGHEDAQAAMRDAIREAIEESETRMIAAMEALGDRLEGGLRAANGRLDDLEKRLSIQKGNLTAVTQQAKALHRDITTVNERVTHVVSEMDGGEEDEGFD